MSPLLVPMVALLALTSLHAGDVLDALRSAYRGDPIAERITIAHTVARRTAFDELTVRVLHTPDQRQTRIELPTLTISASGDDAHTRIVAVRPDNHAVALVREFDEPLTSSLLLRVFPPIPAPQLALAFDEDTPPAPSHARAFEQTAPDRLIGQAEGERTTLVLAPTGRLAQMRVETDGTILRLRIEPVDAGDPQQWGIDTSDRRIVHDLRALRPPPQPFALHEEFPISELQDARLAIWSLDQVLTPDENLRRVEERYLVLVFFRLPDAIPEQASVLKQVDAAIDAAQRAADDLARRSRSPEGLGPRRALVRTIVRPVACLEVSQARRRTIEDLARRWRLEDGPSALLWTLSPSDTIDRLAPRADVAIAILDQQRRLVSVVVPKDQPRADQIRRAIEREVTLVPIP